MTKRNPGIYKKYTDTHPQYPFRLPATLKDEIEEKRLELGLSKQEFMQRVFELGYPRLVGG